jgi:tetratricopeptide (TPR) repeat protein
MKAMFPVCAQWTLCLFSVLFLGCSGATTQVAKDSRSKGQQALDQGRVGDAVDAFKADLQENPGNTESQRLLAMAYKRKGDFISAIKALNKVVKTDPTDGVAWKSLGQLQFALGHYRHAQVALRNARSAGDFSPQTAAQLAESLLQLAQPNAALELLAIALKHYPRDSQLHLTRGRVLRARNKPDEAVVAFRYAARLDTKNAEAPLEAGKTYEQMGFSKRSVKYYKEAVKRQPDHVTSLVRLGHILIQTGKLQEAIPVLERAALLDPQNAIIRNNLGVAFSASGLSQKAVNAYQEAIKLGLRSPAVHSNLAEAHYLSGHLEDAERELQIVLGMDPSRQLDQAAIRRIVVMNELVKAHCSSKKQPSPALIKKRVQTRWKKKKWKDGFEDALITLQRDSAAMAIVGREVDRCRKVSPVTN